MTNMSIEVLENNKTKDDRLLGQLTVKAFPFIANRNTLFLLIF